MLKTLLIAALVLAQPAWAQDDRPEGLRILDAAGIEPDSFLWQYRIVAVLADSPLDPAFARQMREIEDHPENQTRLQDWISFSVWLS